MLTVVISAVVSVLVSLVTAKHCFDKIDGYVKDMTEELNGALDKLMNRFGPDQKNR